MNQQGEVLLVKHSFGSDAWMLPGGGVKQAESPQIAGIREVKEELSLDIEEKDTTRLHDEAKIWKVDGLVFRVIIFKTQIQSSELATITPSHEIRAYSWFDTNSEEFKQALPADLSV